MQIRNAVSSDYKDVEHLFQGENQFSHDLEPERTASTSDVLKQSELDKMITSDGVMLALSEEDGVITGFITKSLGSTISNF